MVIFIVELSDKVVCWILRVVVWKLFVWGGKILIGVVGGMFEMGGGGLEGFRDIDCR